MALVRRERRDAPAQLGRSLVRDHACLRPFVGIRRGIEGPRGEAAAPVVDRGVASDTEKPRADARATGPIARDRNDCPLAGERRQVRRVVPVGGPGPQVAEHGTPVSKVERLERRDVVPGGESEVVVQIEAPSCVAGDVLELLHPGRPSSAGSFILSYERLGDIRTRANRRRTDPSLCDPYDATQASSAST